MEMSLRIIEMGNGSEHNSVEQAEVCTYTGRRQDDTPHRKGALPSRRHHASHKARLKKVLKNLQTAYSQLNSTL